MTYTKEEKATYVREWRKKNPEAARRIDLRNQRQRREKYHTDHAWREQKKQKVRNALFKMKYGITLEIYNAMLAEQGGLCAICRRPERRMWKGQIKNLVVDHDHTTGKVRGLLCDDCNLALGRFQDSAEIVRRVLTYLSGE